MLADGFSFIHSPNILLQARLSVASARYGQGGAAYSTLSFAHTPPR